MERARRWVDAMQEAAKVRGLPPLTTYTEVPGISHDFDQFCREGGLASRVVRSLFGAADEVSRSILSPLPADMESAKPSVIDVQGAV